MRILIPRLVFVLGWMLAVTGAASGATPFDPPPKVPSFAAPPAVAAPRVPIARRLAQPVASVPIPRAIAPAPVIPGLPKHVQNVIDFYGGTTSGRALSQFQSRPSSGTSSSYSRPAASRQSRKPFAKMNHSPTLSPYLNLFREENNSYLPNYHAYVRPQRQQQQTVRLQRAEITRLQKQVRTVSFGSAVGAKASQGAPATGHSTRYLNTAGYYPSAGVMR